jgi:uncharacterized membrane protein
MMSLRKEFARWQANFYTGLAVVLPVVLSIAILIWLFGSVANITDKLLIPLKFVLAKEFIYVDGRGGSVFWYWSLAALILAIFLIGLIGGLTRYYLGKKLIQLMDYAMFRVPLLNKIYGATKQINDAFTTNNRATFKQVVLVEFPKVGTWSIGLMTGEDHAEICSKTGESIVSVVVPTTPNPTTGYLIFVSEDKVIKLDMSVADGVKYIVSLGSVSPSYRAVAQSQLLGQTAVRLNPMPAPSVDEKIKANS